MSFVCLLSFVFTSKIECSECCVWFQCFTQWRHSCVSNLVPCCREKKWVEWIVDGCLLCAFFLLSSHLRLSSVSVVFDFNASLNDVVPLPPILLTVDVKSKEKSDLLMDVFVSLLSFVFTTQIEFRECCVQFQWFTQWCCSCVSNLVPCWCKEKEKEGYVYGCLLSVLFLFSYSQCRSSSVSAVFDFNDSLNDVAPVSPILLSVYVMGKGKEWVVGGCLYSFFYYHTV